MDKDEKLTLTRGDLDRLLKGLPGTVNQVEWLIERYEYWKGMAWMLQGKLYDAQDEFRREQREKLAWMRKWKVLEEEPSPSTGSCPNCKENAAERKEVSSLVCSPQTDVTGWSMIGRSALIKLVKDWRERYRLRRLVPRRV